MVAHEVQVRGVSLGGVTRPKPVLLQMNDDDFPARFLQDLSTPGQPHISSAKSVTDLPARPSVLYQPVQRLVHLALLQAACDSLGQPRIDPARVQSAGLVIRRVPRRNGIDDPAGSPWAWMRSPDGRFQWIKLNGGQEDADPDPSKRPQLQSGQAELDRQLMAQSLASSLTEGATPAFVAAPAVCDAIGRTVLYALVPTASSEATDSAPAAPVYDAATLATSLPTLLQAGGHYAPQAGNSVDYRFMSDDYARNNGATDFLTFSATLRMLYSQFGAFEPTPEGQRLLQLLNRHNVTFGSGSSATTQSMGAFYQAAAAALLDYDPNAQPPRSVPVVTMPDAWDSFSQADQDSVVSAASVALRARSSKVLAPQGRFQDATRLYRLRIFLRIKGETPACPAELVWSDYSDPFRIAAWYESSGRPLPPVPLPDPTQRSFLQNAKPSVSFAVPAGLMNAMNGASMSKLTDGQGGGGGSIQLNWICGFNIPIITICAFFVLNIFLTLLNIVFFWLPFVKICIPIPLPSPPPGEE